MPPSLFVSNTDSLGEQIQRTFPDAHVVKTLNIVNCEVMVDAGKSGGDPTMFVSGNDADAKKNKPSVYCTLSGGMTSSTSAISVRRVERSKCCLFGYAPTWRPETGILHSRSCVPK